MPIKTDHEPKVQLSETRIRYDKLQRASDLLDDGRCDEAIGIMKKLGVSTDGDLHQNVSEALSPLNTALYSSRRKVSPVSSVDSEQRTGNSTGIQRTARIMDHALPFAGIPEVLKGDLHRELLERGITNGDFEPAALDGLFLQSMYKTFGKSKNPMGHGISAAYFLTASEPAVIVTLDIAKKVRPFRNPTVSTGVYSSLDSNFSIVLEIHSPTAHQSLGRFCVEARFSPEALSDEASPRAALRTPSESQYSFAPNAIMSILQHGNIVGLERSERPVQVCQRIEDQLLAKHFLGALAHARRDGHLAGNLPGGVHMLEVFRELRLEEDLRTLQRSGDLAALIEAAASGENLGNFSYMPQSVATIAAGFRGASR